MMKRRDYFFEIIAVSILFLVAITCVHSYVYPKKIDAVYEAQLNEADRENAILTLSELKGKTEMLEYISWHYVSNPEEIDKILKAQLEVILEYENDENSYLKDFEISIDNDADEIGDLCEEIISQINEKLHSIRVEETEGN